MKILVLGITGMLGHKLFQQFSQCEELDVYATARTLENAREYFPGKMAEKIYTGVTTDDFDSFIRVFGEVKPDVAVNCIGVIKQLRSASDPLIAINVNALFPHKIANLCRASNTRMVTVSTDCVFDGKKGNYTEEDNPNALDLYGRSKLLGEVDQPHCITLRTSIIGHELNTRNGLIEWFMSQEGKIKGFTKMIYSGFPTVEFAGIISRYVFPNPELHGVYQVSANAISKYDLLKMVARRYEKVIEIEPVDEPVIDRSLDSRRFQAASGYIPPDWETLVDGMANDYFNSSVYQGNRRS